MLSMKNKNVLHIITVSFVINHFFGNQFNYLKKATGNNYILGCSPSEEFFELAEKFNYTPFPVEVTRNISVLTDLKAILKIYFFIKKNNIDIVIGHTPKGGLVSMIAAYLAGVKDRVYFRHGIFYETSTGLKRKILINIDRLSGSLATKVVCVSKSVEKISIQDNLNNHQKNVVLGLGTCNGIDTEYKFNPDTYSSEVLLNLKEKYSIKKDDFVVGYVGRLVKDKGINELVEAYKIVKKDRPHLKLLLVGPFEEKDAVSAETRQTIESDSDIIYTGFTLSAAPFYNLMEVFVLPTYREGFPTVTLEASSMMLPVISTRATGCEESVIENQTGIFVKNDATDIADKILMYINNPDIKKQHGIAGRKFVKENVEQHKIWNIIHERLGY